MKVLVYAPLAALGHHFETDLEIAQKHLDAGDQVTIVTCDSSLKTFQFYGCSGALRCTFCQSRCQQGLSLLKNTRLLKIVKLSEITPSSRYSTTSVSQQKEIEIIKYKNIEIGSSYVSTLISDVRDPLVNYVARTKKTRMVLDAMASHVDELEKLLDVEMPEQVYLFNGRFTLFRPLMQICQNRGIRVYVHERGGNNQLYSLTKNNMPHDIKTKEAEINQVWADPARNKEEKTKIGSDWFEGRAQGRGFAWYSFTDQQKQAQLPTGWSDQQFNIGLFVSSDDEFVSVSGWELEIFESQYDAVSFILKHFSQRPEFKFYVRMHPNLKGINNRDIDRLRGLDKEYSNCFVVTPESDVSSYYLMQRSNQVISFGSTTGIEAAYLKKPSILIGKAFYMNSKSVYLPKTKQECLNLIENKNLPTLSNDGAIQYGYWAATIGERFKYYEAVTLTTGRFNGQFITGNRTLMWVSYFFVALNDLKKIARGEYGFSHLKAKIKAKIHLLKA